MSDKSIVITEKQIVDAMDEMCYESLNPELHDAWAKIVTNLIEIRKGLANYPKESAEQYKRKTTDNKPFGWFNSASCQFYTEQQKDTQENYHYAGYITNNCIPLFRCMVAERKP